MPRRGLSQPHDWLAGLEQGPRLGSQGLSASPRLERGSRVGSAQGAASELERDQRS